MKRELGILLVAVGLVGGCGGKNNTCVPGTSSACACSDGSAGAQVCGGNGTYGACACSGGTGGNGMGGGGGTNGGGGSGGGGGDTNGGGGAGGGGGGNGVSSGPISIANPSARSTGNGGYQISFVIDNAGVPTQHYLERLDLVRLTWGATTLSVNPECQAEPWVTTSPESGAITIGFTVYSSGATSVFVPCGSNSTGLDGGNATTMPSTAIGLDFEGIMDDAAPFKATASAPIL